MVHLHIRKHIQYSWNNFFINKSNYEGISESYIRDSLHTVAVSNQHTANSRLLLTLMSIFNISLCTEGHQQTSLLMPYWMKWVPCARNNALVACINLKSDRNQQPARWFFNGPNWQAHMTADQHHTMLTNKTARLFNDCRNTCRHTLPCRKMKPEAWECFPLILCFSFTGAELYQSQLMIVPQSRTSTRRVPSSQKISQLDVACSQCNGGFIFCRGGHMLPLHGHLFYLGM
jgi:hypothetical protein